MAHTTFSALKRNKRRIQTNITAFPADPKTGDFFFDSFRNAWVVYDTNQWYFAPVTTTTSTSTSTTSTSTSTTSTSTSTSSSSSTSTSTSTSTTTTL